MSNELLLSLPEDETDHSADPVPAAEARSRASRGDWVGAERLFEEARAAATRAADDVAVAVALTNRGQALARLGRLEEAALILDAALEARRGLHAAGVAGEGVVARGVADVAAVAEALGDPTEAARLLRRARAHAVAGGAEELVAAIDERLAGAHALGASEVDMVEVGTATPDPLVLVVPPDAVEEPSTLALDAFTADELEADEASEGPALMFLDAGPLDGTEPLGDELPLLDTAAGVALEPLVVGALPAAAEAPSLGADLPIEVVASPEHVDDELMIEVAGQLDADPAGHADLLLVTGSFAGTEILSGVEPLDQEMPVDATVPREWLAPAAEAMEAFASDIDADAEGAAEDAWSQVDPSPFEGLDAEEVHTRAVALDTSPRGHPVISLEPEPDGLASADALLELDEEGEPTVEPAEAWGEAPEPEVAAPAPAAPQKRRRTTRDVPLVAPPEPKRSWWRRLTGSRV